MVVVDDPQGPMVERYGGRVAAPIFSEIATRAIRTLGVERPPALLIRTPSAVPARIAPDGGLHPGSVELSPITVAP